MLPVINESLKAVVQYMDSSARPPCGFHYSLAIHSIYGKLFNFSVPQFLHLKRED